jgi:hypothetical protein
MADLQRRRPCANASSNYLHGCSLDGKRYLWLAAGRRHQRRILVLRPAAGMSATVLYRPPLPSRVAFQLATACDNCRPALRTRLTAHCPKRRVPDSP